MQIISQYKNKWLPEETQRNPLKETVKKWKDQFQGKGMILQEYYPTEDDYDILLTDSSLFFISLFYPLLLYHSSNQWAIPVKNQKNSALSTATDPING